MAEAKGYLFGCVTTVGVIGSAIGIFVFVTGYDTFEEAVGKNPNPIEYEDYTKTIHRSAINDYKRYVSEANTDAPQFHLLASRVSGWRGDEHTLVLLECSDQRCEENALFETDNDETIVNASMDRSHNLIVAFTERRIIYINLSSRIFTETPYSYSCSWLSNKLVDQPPDRPVEQIMLTRQGAILDVQFQFSGWTCYQLTIGDVRLNLRPRPLLEYNDFERYRIRMSIDRLGLVTPQSSTALQT